MRLALFGGTFDPVHWGHLLLADCARTAYQLDRVLFIPTGQPPHKSASVASPAHRVRMLRQAVAYNPYFAVNDWEIRQKRVVYSYETIAHFRRLHPRGTLYFIVGTDMLKNIDRWKQGRSLLDQCVFLAAERPESPWTSLPAGLRRKSKRIPWPEVSLASHEIRARIKKGQPVRDQVPAPVERYIRKYRLYA